MTDNNRIRRDMLFLYSGVALGALLGMIGSMFVAWWFETYKNEKWMPYIA
jgi:putative effector of murein hydrolase